MTKSLEQIQKENRKFILGALEGVDGSLSKDLFNSKPLTLSRVLLALKDKQIGFYNDCLGEVWEIASGGYREDYLEYICDWNLALGEIELTLEEQTEETQRGINKLFND